jgi:6-pyruvoyltetrahydropterin/6-carboxytetrahydropterin synthase
MTFQISKDFSFSASHILDGLPEGHQCGRLHGHNYLIRLELSSDHLDSHGFIYDYGDLKPFGAWLDDNLDHRHLNDQLDFQPTAENMAHFLAKLAVELLDLDPSISVSCSVSETPKSWARWVP